MGVLACSLAALLLVAAPTPKYLQTAVQDDALFLHQPPAVVRTAARQLGSRTSAADQAPGGQSGSSRIRTAPSTSSIG